MARMPAAALALAPLAAALAFLQDPQPPAPAPEPPPLAVRVNQAIARGVQHLRSTQGADGRWLGDETRFPGGMTAFAAYTLQKSGVRRGAPEVSSALRALAAIPPRSTYDTSVRLLLYQTLGDGTAWRAEAERCLAALVTTQREGAWGYPEDPLDLSNAQFALLGLRAAHDLGLEVPEETLVDAARALWRSQEEASGGFRYREEMPATGGMTAAALGSAALLDGFAAGSPALAAVLKKHRKDLVRAHDWLALRWDPAHNAWGPRTWTPGWHTAYLWAVERYCELAGLQELGGRDWYKEGAEYLVGIQAADGAFGEKLEDTCFALLFLRRTTFSGGKELAGLDGAAPPANGRAPEPALDAAAPWLTSWLVAGPIRGADGDSGLAAPPFDPSKVKAKPGAKVERAALEPVELKGDGWTNLEELTGRGADLELWVLATELSVPEGPGATAPVDLVLWLSFEDGWRVLLDGAELSRGERVQAPIRPDVRVPLHLAPGPHALVVVVEDALGSAAFEARISDPEGKAPAVRVEARNGAEKKKR
jgi:hypothetical protein